MRVLVTGGSGFLGCWIVKGLLDAGIDVTVLDLTDDHRVATRVLGDRVQDVQWITGDISSFGAVFAAARGCDQIIHLAALLTPDCASDPIRGLNVNVEGTLNIFEAARRHELKQVLYMSSASVFGPDDGANPFPITLYGVWKLAMEGVARCMLEEHGIQSAGFRPLVVYGPCRDVGISAGPSLAIEAALKGEPYTIAFSGSTDLVHVDDVVAAYVECASRGVTGARTYTITGEMASMDEWIAAIRTRFPDAAITSTGPLLPVAARIDPGSLRDDFPAIPCTGIQDGINRTIDWHQ